MYKIRGSDQKEYGPVNGDMVRQWIADQRANAQTLVQAEGSVDWKPLSQFSEFSAALAGGARPPTVPGRSAPPLPAPAMPPKTSGMAIASLVLGCCGVVSCGLTALPGLVLGILSLSRINKSQGRIAGKGVGIAGICVSGLFLIMLPIYIAIAIPAFSKAKSRALEIRCMNNLKQLGLATLLYANANNGELPLSTNWCDAVQVNLGSQKNSPFQCPRAPKGQRSSYGFNQMLNGRKLGELNPATVLLFETDEGWNVSGGPGSMISRSRHHSTFGVCFADGSARQVPASGLTALRWEP